MGRHRWALSPILLALTMCAPTSAPPAAAAPRPPAVAAQVRRVADSGSAPPSAASAVEAAEPDSELSPELQKLWQARITPRIKREPWKTPGRYDAASLLMLPMHAAFERRYLPGQEEFADHVTRFLQYRDSVDLRGQDVLDWIQYFYFLSRYTVVATTHDRADLVPAPLPEALRAWVGGLWLRIPAWQWYRKPFPGGMRERLNWKLSGARALRGKSFEHAVRDQELLLFAIAADLRSYGRAVGSKLADDPVLEEIDRYARRVYANRVGWNRDSGWTFQPGLLRDHPDHRFQCRHEKRAGLEPCSTATGVDDASHAHRYPLMLRSMAESEPAGSKDRAFYERLLQGLERQFFRRIVVPPSADFPGWRIHNYMDGENGMYRRQYRSLGPNQGYGPFQVSGALLQGWWTFLPGPRARELYRRIAMQFPLTEQQLAVYGGPTRKPGSSGILADGTVELICRLAAEAPRPALGGQ
jgi:hypothetical protein